MSAGSFLTDCGFAGVRWVPYGLHGCHFYHSREDITASLVAFLLSGLYLGERCLWIAAPPLPAAEARREMATAWHGCERALSVGALRIVDFPTWLGEVGTARLLDALAREEEAALREGYRGLRVSGNMSGLHPDEHAAFHEYERQGARLNGRRILALCSYDLGSLSKAHRDEIESAHDCAFEREPDGAWQLRWPTTASPRRAAPSGPRRPAPRRD
jgi:two-component system sensor kinase FixL